MSRHENDGKPTYADRNILGYGEKAPNPTWPNNATVAINFVIHYEEGGESCVLHGDNDAEPRNLIAESEMEYGSRVGFWRLLRLFQKKKLPCTIFAVGMALERNPAICYELKKTWCRENWEVASHGYRYIDYKQCTPEIEQEHLQRTINVHRKIFGRHPAGYYQGTPTSHTRKMIVEEGGFKYDCDSYGDDLPYWSVAHGKPHLIIPHTLTENDIRYSTSNGFVTGKEFCEHLKQTIQYLMDKAEGEGGTPKLMTIALHSRFARPAYVAALEEFCEFLENCFNPKDLWIATKEQVADHWIEHHAPMGRGGKILTPAEKAQIALRKGEMILRKLAGGGSGRSLLGK